ncbi:M50 family metallopeptidase [Pseudonocardia halophobica]|uniref:Membrane protein n=2 Tax=Pseudonocardia halophobica TaxID=29401 RepID=A0A9W6L4D6_9PSEU|nr:membrane protein [Pseudonocardia halophobica]
MPLIGTPVVAGIGFVVFVLVFLPVTASWIGSISTIAHEGGHVAMAILTFRNPKGFVLDENTHGGSGGSTDADSSWGAGAILTGIVGYATPPLLGWGGAHLVAEGRAVAVLWIAAVLLLSSFFMARGLFTNLVVLLVGAGIVWALVGGNAAWQAAVAVGLVWVMLFGAIKGLLQLGFGSRGDAAILARVTWIPAIIWILGWWALTLVCLYRGVRLLLPF